jgi:thiosulfate/3-mercaptopyruvate sulfurtransferase
MTTDSDLITVKRLQARLDAGDCRVVDCRFDLFDPGKGRLEYLDGHLPGAVYADLDKDLAGAVTETTGRHPLPDPEAFIARLRRWGIDNDSHVVVYDHGNAAFASRLWWMLKCWLGHERVAVLDGGFAAWRAAGGSLETAEPGHDPGSFRATANDACVATVDELSNAIARDRPIHLVDARDPARFRGQAEPIDPVAGHVPGARSLPLGVSLDPEGCWQRPEALGQVWREFLASGPDTPPVVMCGSGVTACHLVLSAVLAGVAPPRLYVGSWSEWIRDPSRPIAVEN